MNHKVEDSEAPMLPTNDAFDPLPILNERAAQMGISIKWEENSTGPAHTPRWDVKCLVNGVVRGVGQGGGKKTARRTAAAHALSGLGWVGGAATSFEPGTGGVNSPSVLETFARQKGHRLEWTSQRSGPDHTPTWHVCCLVDGTIIGQGSASKILAAKREAARQTFISMGWINSG
ncbi:uncharacterized protein STEHIDRAFT_155145 [Stereum hirsutum FP-91666 SS1]|uniref:uncharacterized protein n=1 Tax=Stereum hirsutum (strain FP-91666) TaxID=721885 RepID=UPI000440D99B|nr:uncharacterized protein STEHIDRAFT_155145 [Stereum hirsutum FP-91666 SS1]EIM87772.1 hypothetical protein STEHIDRAFT_155145 [Stereum hirsutum FP-91666 SS1]